MKYSAEELSRAGDKYLGRSYSEMDCQEFMERCLADTGYVRNLPGSNAWYRAMDWTGTPEECERAFGSVPRGAFLFILEQDGKEPGKYRGDGIGNASHIGIKTGRNKGAIHSSASRGCVAVSAFRDRTIPNGGWNRVGLLREFDYGISVNERLEYGGKETAGISVKGGKNMQGTSGTICSENGLPVNVRKGPGITYALVDRYPAGTGLEITGETGDWYSVLVCGRKGWMMKRFVRTGENNESGPGSSASGGGGWSVTISGLDLTQARALVNNYPGNSVMEEEKG